MPSIKKKIPLSLSTYYLALSKGKVENSNGTSVLCVFNGSHGNIGSPVFTGLSTLNKTTNDKLVCESQQKYYQIVLLNLNKKHILNIIKMIMDACFFEL